MSLNRERYLALLGKLIAETPHLMNKPPDHVPQEALAARHVLDLLRPHEGTLRVREVQHHEGRSNLIVEYPADPEAVAAAGGERRCVSFVGSHFDVVHADPKDWEFDPFTLGVEGDTLRGRGTTDCLGHVALLTELFLHLAEKRPKLSCSVYGVYIADEEVGADPLIGVTGLMRKGLLDDLKHGPVYWLDCADCQPNVGSGGQVTWRLTAHGSVGHSGFPDKSCNAIELAYDALRHVQRRFYEAFPTHEREAEYGFPCSSSLKATRVSAPDGGLNQIKGTASLSGDIRLIPFYKIADAKAAVERCVRELNEGGLDEALRPAGPSSYKGGRVELEWLGEGMDGLAASLTSPGFRALAEATAKYFGKCEPLADTGSLPLVAELQAFGWDVQTVGYGIEDYYHADNERASLDWFEKGFKVLVRVIEQLNAGKFP